MNIGFLYGAIGLFPSVKMLPLSKHPSLVVLLYDSKSSFCFNNGECNVILERGGGIVGTIFFFLT